MATSPSSPTRRSPPAAPATHALTSAADAEASRIRPPSSVCAASPGSASVPALLTSRPPGSVQNRRTVVAPLPAPDFATPPPSSGSTPGPAPDAPDRRRLPHATAAAAAVPAARSALTAPQLPIAPNAFLPLPAALLTDPALVGSFPFAPLSWSLLPSMKEDISTLRKPDIITLRPQGIFSGLTIITPSADYRVCVSVGAFILWRPSQIGAPLP